MDKLPKGVKIGLGVSFAGIASLAVGTGCWSGPGAFIVLGIGTVIMGIVIAITVCEYDR